MSDKKKPLLIVTLGYPGSGKTHFSERLARDYNLIHLNSDKVRGEMFKEPKYTPAEHGAVFGFINWMAEELLKKGMGVMVDANANRRGARAKYARLAGNVGAQYMLVYIVTSLALAEKRLIERASITDIEKKKYYRPVSLSVLHAMKGKIEYPEADEPAVQIDGTIPYAQQRAAFEAYLSHAS